MKKVPRWTRHIPEHPVRYLRRPPLLWIEIMLKNSEDTNPCQFCRNIEVVLPVILTCTRHEVRGGGVYKTFSDGSSFFWLFLIYSIISYFDEILVQWFWKEYWYTLYSYSISLLVKNCVLSGFMCFCVMLSWVGYSKYSDRTSTI